MILRKAFPRKKIITGAIIAAILLLIYVFLSLFVFGPNPVTMLFGMIDSYLLFAEKIANQFLLWSGAAVRIEQHAIMLFNDLLGIVDSGVLQKKFSILFFLAIWIIPASLKPRLIYSFLLLVLNLAAATVTLALQAHFTILAPQMFQGFSPILISRTPGVLIMTTIFSVWLWKNQDTIIKSLGRLRLDLSFLQSKIPVIIIFLYIYAILSNFLYGCFEYSGWINFLFSSAQRILLLFGVEAGVEPSYLIGEKGVIYMASGCLGFRTMLLFATLVYITGENLLVRWIYIGVGLILLNLVNIFRFVFLFIHVQKHGGYALNIDLHDLYNYVIYAFVFILWVIWFEKFADMKSIITKKNRNSETPANDLRTS